MWCFTEHRAVESDNSPLEKSLGVQKAGVSAEPQWRAGTGEVMVPMELQKKKKETKTHTQRAHLVFVKFILVDSASFFRHLYVELPVIKAYKIWIIPLQKKKKKTGWQKLLHGPRSNRFWSVQ